MQRVVVPCVDIRLVGRELDFQRAVLCALRGPKIFFCSILLCAPCSTEPESALYYFDYSERDGCLHVRSCVLHIAKTVKRLIQMGVQRTYWISELAL